jgi:hypothetical protein
MALALANAMSNLPAVARRMDAEALAQTSTTVRAAGSRTGHIKVRTWKR